MYFNVNYDGICWYSTDWPISAHLRPCRSTLTSLSRFARLSLDSNRKWSNNLDSNCCKVWTMALNMGVLQTCRGVEPFVYILAVEDYENEVFILHSHHFQLFQMVLVVHEVPLVPVEHKWIMCCAHCSSSHWCTFIVQFSNCWRRVHFFLWCFASHSGTDSDTYSWTRLSSLTRASLESLWPLV